DRAGEAPACRVRDRPSDDASAEILVGRNVNHAGLRAERDRRPVLSAPMGRTEVGLLAGTRLTSGINVRPSGLRVEAPEDVLFHERLALDEVDLAASPLEEPEVAVARDVDQAFDRPAVAH